MLILVRFACKVYIYMYLICRSNSVKDSFKRMRETECVTLDGGGTDVEK